MMDLTIREIAQACGGRLVVQGGKADENSRVSCVVIDSRQIEPQGVFVATVGEKVDGHTFIASTFARGAILAVTQKTPEQVEAQSLQKSGQSITQRRQAEEKGEAAGWGCYVLVEDTLQALKQIAEAYRRKLNIKTVGITGSAGKTSTKEFIAGVLARQYHVLKTEGNFNNEIGVPLTLLRIRGEHEVAVVEMGISDFGEMHRLSKMVRPDVCVITNIGQSHLNNLIDRDGILRAKSEIFDYMAQDGEICLNCEDDKLSPLKEIKGHRPHFFGLGRNPAEEVSMTEITGKGLRGSEATLTIRRELSGQEGAETKRVTVPLPGGHMVLNAAAAACVGEVLDLAIDEIAAGLADVTAVSGRTNILQTSHYTVIDDCYNANPASVKAALELLAQADTHKVAILGDMLNLGEESDRYHAQAGRRAAELGIDFIVCVGEQSRHMFEAAKKQGNGQVQSFWFPDTGEVLAALEADCSRLIPEGSSVLIKASHDMGFAKILDLVLAR